MLTGRWMPIRGRAPDIAETRLLPDLLAYFARHAPMVQLRTRSIPRHAAAEAMESGLADLATTFWRRATSHTRQGIRCTVAVDARDG